MNHLTVRLFSGQKPIVKSFIPFMPPPRPVHSNKRSFQKHPMAGQGVFLRAHDRNPVALQSFFQSPQAVFEKLRPSNSIVLHPPFFITGGIVAAWPKFLAEMNVGQLVPLQFPLEDFFIVLRIEPAVRAGADIAHRGDVVHAEKLYKAFDRVGGMPDSVNRLHDPICRLACDAAHYTIFISPCGRRVLT